MTRNNLKKGGLPFFTLSRSKVETLFLILFYHLRKEPSNTAKTYYSSGGTFTSTITATWLSGLKNGWFTANMRGITHLCFKWDDAPFRGIKVGQRNQLCLFLSRPETTIQKNWPFSLKVHFRNTNYIKCQCDCNKILNVSYETLIRENVWSGKLCSSPWIFCGLLFAKSALIHSCILLFSTRGQIAPHLCSDFCPSQLVLPTCTYYCHHFSPTVERRKREP